MNWTVLGWWLIWALFWGMFLAFNLSMDNVDIINKNISYIWAQYVAEAWIEKKLLELKVSDIDEVKKFSEEYRKWSQNDNQYWFINESADSWYFDLSLHTSPTASIDLWKIVWWDISFSNLETKDFFNSFELHYNIDTFEDIIVEIISSDRGWNFANCTFEKLTDHTCANSIKSVINTADLSLNWHFMNWLRFYFHSGENGYKNKLLVEGFNDNKDYKISFYSLSSESIEYSYNTIYNWEKKVVANNLIEIENTGNAIDNFSKVKISKRITRDIQYINKYVLFSNNDIVK
jgi:hypothetical protein